MVMLFRTEVSGLTIEAAHGTGLYGRTVCKK